MTTVYYAIFVLVAIFRCTLAYRCTSGLVVERDHAVLIFGAIAGAFSFDFLRSAVLRYSPDFLASAGFTKPFYFAASALSFLSSPPHTLFYGITSSLSSPEAQTVSGNHRPARCISSVFKTARSETVETFRVVFLRRVSASVCDFGDCSNVSLISSAAIRYAIALLSWSALGGFLLLTFRLGALERKARIPDCHQTVRYLRLFCCSH